MGSDRASERIRIGVIGANVSKGWAHRSHLPALLASPEFELTGVCTTRPESAEESARKFGARLAFHNHEDMLASPEIDAVAVVVRVPSHFQLTKDALNAGKHVFTEWPLGATLAEAQELASLARQNGVQTMVGLQARAAPALLYLKELVDSGYVGEVMSCHLRMIRDGVLKRTSDRTWQRDDSLGATTLTIAFGHTVDALRFVVGDFSEVSSVVSTQAPQWLETDTNQLVDVTAPDNILVSGRLANGGVASVHVASLPWAGSGYRMEIYGREGTLAAYSTDSPQLGAVRVQGAKGRGERLQDLEIPARHTYVLEGMPAGAPYNVGQMYYLFGQAIRTGEGGHPDFDTAVELHRFLDAIRESSDQGRQVAVAAA
ncbi:MAG: Gfo/Idh/MocA family oxidoreductase [Chloroflexi bacterium]|nr:Gfo/Idh/MocA family oxidoreductase [Chloroflexota bacterium]